MLDADILTRLQQRQEQLVEVFLDETDPKSFPPARGDRVWHKRDASLTGALIGRIQFILDQALRSPIVPPNEPTPGDDEDRVDTESMAADAMKEANQIIENASRTRFGGKRDGK